MSSMMRRTCTVTRIPVIQLRFSYCDEHGKEQYGHNRKFQKPGVAADHWARHVYIEWRNKTIINIGFNEFARRGWDEWEYREERIKKLTRRSLPIFKSMLK